jgi:hypothetical protein
MALSGKFAIFPSPPSSSPDPLDGTLDASLAVAFLVGLALYFVLPTLDGTLDASLAVAFLAGLFYCLQRPQRRP